MVPVQQLFKVIQSR